ncbi:MAG TPA: sigma-54 dependent transcriptional regulator [Thermodesulfovibrionales bacterium]|nr:sigma-54 dependent transcriptional regulator [Thermodesulfovibrionales bacterium]
MASLLLIDDEESITLSLKTLFETKGYTFFNSYTGAGGLDAALRELPDIVLLDIHLPDMSGMAVLEKLKAIYPDMAVIVLTGYGEIKEAVEAMKIGAEHYFQKPVDLDELSIIVDRSANIGRLRQEVSISRKSPYRIVGRSRQVQGLLHIVNLMAENPSTTVLIRGETGTGKELVARNIHVLSKRSDKLFVDINCASIPENIFESELFGHEMGAFTDAKTTKKGLFEIADGGTLFLDEVAEMPLPLQAKTLRAIETKTFRRIGGTRDIKTDARVIAATNKDLDECVKKGAFREDLYYRLNVMPVQIPPLRERAEDIPLLAEFFIAESAASMNKRIKTMDKDALNTLCAYGWPGNIRELKNVLERAMILCQGQVITGSFLALPAQPAGDRAVMLTLHDVERMHIKNVLESAGNNRTRSAKILGISRSTLNEKIKAYLLS